MPPEAAVTHERMSRLETEVDALKTAVQENRIDVARIQEQVAAHEKRGEERHVQLLTALTEIKNDYRVALREERELTMADKADQRAFWAKIILAGIGLAGGALGVKQVIAPEPPAVVPHVEPAKVEGP